MLSARSGSYRCLGGADRNCLCAWKRSDVDEIFAVKLSSGQ